MNMINTNSLEIFKHNLYNKTNIGLVSNNAYLSIIATNKCQCKCPYCINGDTDMTLDLPLDKAVSNIVALEAKYGVKEAIILGGEPLVYKDIIRLVRRLRHDTNMIIRITTNGILLKRNWSLLNDLCNEFGGIHGLNISWHNEDFLSLKELNQIVVFVKNINPSIKIRINSNIWNGNLDTAERLDKHFALLDFVDEVRISNIIKKDSFSVNDTNKADNLVLSNEEYDKLFCGLIDKYVETHTIIENPETLGFVRYVLIPTKVPIIINWNTSSSVSDQVCENDIEKKKINTFKCLVSGDISLSWNKDNIIEL